MRAGALVLGAGRSSGPHARRSPFEAIYRHGAGFRYPTSPRLSRRVSFRAATRWTMSDPSLQGTLARLDARIDWERRDRSAGWRVDLDPIHDLLVRTGRPDRGFRICHVAGSKGKGSVASLIAAGLRRAGRRVGVYASPHVERIHERIALDGTPIDDAGLVRALTAALDAVEEAERDGGAAAGASWFDIVTAAALCAFRDAGVDWAVLEVGLGGRLDSTNAIDPPALAVVMTIALEHTAILGSTLAEIAAEKGGEARLAMLPIENSIHGRVADKHDLLPESGLYIIGEHFLPIRLQLLGTPGTKLSDVREAYKAQIEQLLSKVIK